MGCTQTKQSNTNKNLKQFDPKLQQVVTVPVLYDPKNNPIVQRRKTDNHSDAQKSPSR